MNRHSLDFDNVLAECLDAMEDKQWSVADCLARYPDYAQDLAPLLRLARQLPRAQGIRPSLAFRQQAPARLRRRLQASNRSPVQPPASRRSAALLKPSFVWSRLAMRVGLPILAVAAFASASAMVARAADDSIPGDTLYLVDLAVEDLELNFAASPQQRLSLQMQYADERIAEAEQLAQRGDATHLEQAVAEYEELVAEARAGLTSANGTSQETLQESLSVHEARLSELLDKVPEQARSGIERAIAASRYGQRHGNPGQQGADDPEGEDQQEDDTSDENSGSGNSGGNGNGNSSGNAGGNNNGGGNGNGSSNGNNNSNGNSNGQGNKNGGGQGGGYPTGTPGRRPTDTPGSGPPENHGGGNDKD